MAALPHCKTTSAARLIMHIKITPLYLFVQAKRDLAGYVFISYNHPVQTALGRVARSLVAKTATTGDNIATLNLREADKERPKYIYKVSLFALICDGDQYFAIRPIEHNR
jgi:hypothetical protein